MSHWGSSKSRAATVLIAALVAVSLAPASPASAGPSVATGVKARGHQSTIALPTGFRPEGIAAGHGKTFYVGSVADGRIWVGDVKSGEGRVLVAPVTGRSLRGLLLDKRSGWLWAVGSQGAEGLVLAVSARTGAVKASIAVPDALFLNDLTVSKGSLWVTDSQVDRLLRIPLDRLGRPVGGYSTLALSAPWPTPEGFRANGITALRDGSLLLDNSTAGGLYTVAPRSGAVTVVPVTGSAAITGGDGLVLRGNTLFIVRGSDNASVTEVRLRHTRAGLQAKVVRLLTDPTLDFPATAALIGGKLWVVNGRFTLTEPDTAAFWLTGLSLGHRHLG
jgi:streptogramin lyase